MDIFSQVTNEDCMALMARYPDKYFELAVVDPPYGIGISKKKTIGKVGKIYSTTRYKQSNWDLEIPNKDYFDELFRVTKDQIIFGANYFSNYLPPSMGWIVYDKRQPENFSMAHAELAFTSFNRSIRMKGFKRNQVQNCVSNNKLVALQNAKIHQCQKPIALYDWIFKNYLPNGGKVLDTHGGSMSSLIAAIKAGNIEMIICELDKDYYNQAKKRVNQFIAQGNLFYERPNIVWIDTQ